MTREYTINYLKSIIEIIEQGCSNHGCAVNKKNVGGQGTNSICQCKPSNIARDLERLAKWLNDGDRMKWEE
jgi:hypothetical protein